MEAAPEFTTPTAREGEAIRKYLEVETEYMAAAGFFQHSENAQIRSHAVSIIATHSPTRDPDAFIPYLAMNYFDRYFSTVQFQHVRHVKSDSEKVRLIALCCLFISAKMRTKTFSVDLFLRDKSINFTHKMIMDMELNILKVLDWRMRPVTAFLYLNYYYRFFKRLGGFKRRCINEIIVQAQGENEFVCYNYKPSQIAMSAFLVAAQIAYPSNKLNYQEEGLSECVRALGDLCGRKNIKIERSKSEAMDSSEEEVEDETKPLIRQTGDKGKEVVLTLEAGTAKGEAEEPPFDEQIATITDEIRNKTHLDEGSLQWDRIEVTEEEKRRLAKGKAVAVSQTSNEEKQRQAPKSILEDENPKLYKEEQQNIAKIEKEARVGRLSELEIVNEPEKLMNFDLKWPTYVPS